MVISKAKKLWHTISKMYRMLVLKRMKIRICLKVTTQNKMKRKDKRDSDYISSLRKIWAKAQKTLMIWWIILTRMCMKTSSLDPSWQTQLVLWFWYKDTGPFIFLCLSFLKSLSLQEITCNVFNTTRVKHHILTTTTRQMEQFWTSQ